MTAPALEIVELTKSFDGVEVVKRISLSIEKGEIFGVLGENGAGKSTLLKMVCGIYTPTSGEMRLSGSPLLLDSPFDAKHKGISMVPQEFNLVDSLKVYENVFLGNELKKAGLFLDHKAMISRTEELLKELESDVSSTDFISDLSVAQKQMVEIAKALVFEASILVMDEPSTVLTDHEVEILFGLMDRLKKRGVTILFISHKLKEIKRMCDRLLIMRDGDLVSVEKVDEIEEADMARLMVGRELNQIFPEKSTPKQEKVLEVSNLIIPPNVDPISFHLRKGEVMGFAGLVGAGRTEVAESIMGLRESNWKFKTVRDALAQKIAYLSEDRQGKGLTLNFGINSNISLMSLKKYGSPFISRKKEREAAEKYIDQFGIRAAQRHGELRYLSGGNQQKVYLSKLMDTDPSILILDEPTRGIDINAKRDIYFFIQDLISKGLSVIVISSELEEIIGLCNRVMVMREGKIVAELEEDQLNEEAIMMHAAGVNESEGELSHV